jgi:glycosyltransferase involved in cell wall biosynthesis
MRVLYRGVLGFLLIKLVNLAVNLVQFPVLKKPDSKLQLVVPAPASPTVSLLVPMRNESANLPRSLPAMLAQQDVAELILLDDQSSDGSAELARSILGGIPNARVVSGAPLPPGWIGKNWACQQLSEQAAGELLMFCDADVVLADGAVPAVLTAMAHQHAEVFSVFPRQRTGSLGEMLLTPLIDDVLLCFLPFGLLSLDVPSAATANGSLLVFRRSAYQLLRGFSAVRSEIVEDVVIARRARAAGLRLGLALGGGLVQTRMYCGYRSAVRGLARGLLPVTGGSRLRLAAAAGWHLAVYTLPLGASIRRRRWLLPLGLGLLERGLVALKCDPRSSWQAALTPLCPIAFVPMAAQAMRRGQHWKGRSYS